MTDEREYPKTYVKKSEDGKSTQVYWGARKIGVYGPYPGLIGIGGRFSVHWYDGLCAFVLAPVQTEDDAVELIVGRGKLWYDSMVDGRPAGKHNCAIAV